MDLTLKFLYQSNYWYNDGLKKATVRDLSGAIRSLEKSLIYNRDNITARNLLGLTYYGCGEIAEALMQWIISKNMKPKSNAANYYIKMIQDSPNELENYKQAIQKFNQCLLYCRQKGEDLAIIQLKKVTAEHPTFLKAHQLLALLYINENQFMNARQVLRKAHKLDNANPMTLAYMYELNKDRKKAPVKVKENKKHTISYNIGNETIIQPVNPDSREKARIFTLLNLLIGAVIGVAVIWFLVIPAVSESMALKTNQDIIAYSDEIAAQNAEISALRKELDNYRSASDETESAQETAKSTQSSYELLLLVEDQLASQSVSNADMAANLEKVNAEALGESAKKTYDSLTSEIYPKVLEKRYSSGKRSYDAADYETAITSMEGVVRLKAGYEDGKALLYLANAYAQSGDDKKAKETYTQLLQLLPDTDIAKKAQKGLDGETPKVEDTDSQNE